MSSRNLLKLDPKIFKEAARRIDEQESHSILHAVTMAVYNSRNFVDPKPYMDAWRREFETMPGLSPFPGSNLKPEEKRNSLLRMAYLAEKEDGT